ncbi:MAG: 1-acyl-sn-glycerol-3-phosphate acyltransferase [Polyangiaceae bacterium]|nr:1-acyl-sn-glycerol-3-phosphate acyltransferase [Polyangiaceae bacterium]
MTRLSAPIFRFNDDRGALVDEVVRRVTAGRRDPQETLSDAIYHEVRRLTATAPRGDELGRWRALARRVGDMTPRELTTEVEALARAHATDVAGNFDPRVYAVATRLMPPVLGALVAPMTTMTSMRRLVDAAALGDRITVEGSIAHVRALSELGTVVYVPTHLSNMDSIVFGYALERAELPPATYGAGKNLFTNPVLSFFMQNLGAYKVDRRLRHALYKDVLKAYSCLLIERGYHSLFFPGGTRSRSGGVERRLKLGLAGTGVEAFVRTSLAGAPRRVFFVPATIAYLVTLEAETLIEDFLHESGKSRYIIEDDESSRWEKVASFSNKLLKHDGGVVVRFGAPLDPFGNLVDEQGDSLSPRGRVVDPRSYVTNRRGEVAHDADRDAEYTRELGDAICGSFARNTVVLATNLVAAAMMNRLRESAGTDDIFTLLRVRQRAPATRHDVARDVAALRDRVAVLDRDGRALLGRSLRAATGEEILGEALRAWRGAHTSPVIEERGGELSIGDAPLVFYYQNRLAAHGVALDVLAPRRADGGAS